METIISRKKWLNIISLLLVLPTVYFISISVLKYEFGIDGPFDAIAPWLESMGIKESLGWNINLVILLGPIIALVLSVLQVLGAEWKFSKEEFQFRFSIQKRWMPLSIVFLSGLVLATLALYLLAENCNCP